jgi:hypothetical protein
VKSPKVLSSTLLPEIRTRSSVQHGCCSEISNPPLTRRFSCPKHRHAAADVPGQGSRLPCSLENKVSWPQWNNPQLSATDG